MDIWKTLQWYFMMLPQIPTIFLKLKHAITLIQKLSSEINETEINSIIDKINSPIFTIPGINYNVGIMIIAEMAFSVTLIPLTGYSLMHAFTTLRNWLIIIYIEKRSSRYRQYILYNTIKYVRHWNESFGTYLAQKCSKDKHYNVVSQTTKELARNIYLQMWICVI